jgi:carbon storage regulator
MLVLSRKKNQGIMLGDDIKISILEIKEDTVKIGIDAPKATIILRSELYNAVSDENVTAVNIDKAAVDLLKGLMPVKK